VLFDLDDTLYPESTYVLSGFRTVAQYLGEAYGVDIADTYARLAFAFKSGIRGNTFDLVLRDLGLSTQTGLVQRLVEVYRTHDPEITLHSDAARALSSLCSRLPIGLLTDGYASVQRRKVKALGIEPFFDAIVYSDDLGREHWKPSTVPFQYLLCRLGIEPKGAVYIGDNPSKDFIGARSLGITTIRVVRSGAEHCQTLPEPGFEADYDLMTLDMLPAFLIGQSDI
jgi:putative hydrolase of the HAD superfamily